MYTFFLVVHAIVAAALVGVILMQRSEGGGLAGGGNPAGLMSARGAADFLTRTTTVLATLFVTLSIALAAIAITNRAPDDLDTSLARKAAPTAPVAPPSGVPMAGGTPSQPAGEGPIVEDNVIAPAKPVTQPEAKPETEKTAPKPVARESAPAPKAATPKPDAAKPAAEKVTPPPVVTPPAAAPAETGNSPQ
jgi:preprotein translocase subunit SecG